MEEHKQAILRILETLDEERLEKIENIVQMLASANSRALTLIYKTAVSIIKTIK